MGDPQFINAADLKDVPVVVLRRCPFCGGEASVDFGGARQDDGSRVGFAFVRCETCKADKGAITGAPDGTQARAEATTLWNRRAPITDTDVEQAVVAMRNAFVVAKEISTDGQVPFATLARAVLESISQR